MPNSDHEAHWPRIKKLAEAGDSAAILSLADAFSDPRERVAFLRFLIRCLAFKEWDGMNLDLVVEVGDGAIQEMLDFAEKESVDGEWFLEQANMTSYNMSANLADCWGDGFDREPRHFEHGLRYADDALRFRQRLDKGSGAFSMAYWAKGTHELSLGKFAEAVESFRKSLDYAKEDAKSNGAATALTADAPFPIVLGYGYLGIALHASGDETGESMYQSALRCFEEMKSHSPEDAAAGIEQLKLTYDNHS